jgi:PAS domain S-box-containing protein
MFAEMAASRTHSSMTPLRHPGPLRFVQLAESGIVGVCIGNVCGELLDANDSYLSLLGFSRDEFEAGFVKWSERMPPEWAEAHRAALDSLKRTGAAAPWEAELIRRDGRRVPVMIAVGTPSRRACSRRTSSPPTRCSRSSTKFDRGRPRRGSHSPAPDVQSEPSRPHLAARS